MAPGLNPAGHEERAGCGLTVDQKLRDAVLLSGFNARQM